jgi:DNA-directed RNA polymerase specialized sigma24 family protein
MEQYIFNESRKATSIDSEFIENFEAKRKSYKLFVDTYKNQIYSFLAYMTGNVEMAMADTREIFLKAYYKIIKVKDAKELKFWLFNKTYSYVKKIDRIGEDENTLDIPNDEEYMDLEGINVPYTIQKIDFRTNPDAINQWECINQIFSFIEFENRAILILKDILKLEIDFICKILDMSEGTVRFRLNKSRMIFSEQSKNIEIKRSDQ